MRISFEVDGVQQTIRAFQQVERGIVDLRELGTWDWVQSEYYKVVKEIMDSEGSAGQSGRWKALTPKYAAVKRATYGDKPILQATGEMYTSLTTSGGGAVVEKSAQEMTLGSSNPKAGWHNRGAGRLPRRKIIDFTDEQKKRIVAPIEKKMRQLVDNAKLRDIRGF